MDPAHQRHMTEDEYLAFERDSEEKHEFVNGEIIDMAGGTPRHSLLAMNFARALGNKLASKGCLVFTSDLRVNVATTNLYAYPDVAVVCGRAEYHPKDRHVVLNPTMVIEVLSESTQGYDRGPKAAHYRQSPSLREYVFVSQDERRVEHYRRIEGDQWLFTESTEERPIAIQCLGAEISLEQIYENVELLEAEGGSGGGAAS